MQIERSTAVEAGRRLALCWWPEDRPDEPSTVELRLWPDAGGTRSP